MTRGTGPGSTANPILSLAIGKIDGTFPRFVIAKLLQPISLHE
jgi:hypothetical protein